MNKTPPSSDTPLTDQELYDLGTRAKTSMMALVDSLDPQIGSEVVEVGRHMSAHTAMLNAGYTPHYQPHPNDPTKRGQKPQAGAPRDTNIMLLFHCAVAVKLFSDIVRAGRDNHAKYDAPFKAAVERLQDFASSPFDPAEWHIRGHVNEGFYLERL